MIALAATLLAAVSAPTFALHAGATITDDLGRPSAMVRHVDIYTPEPQPSIGTLAFKGLLAEHAGQVLQVCVRSRAVRPGGLVVWIPRAVEDLIEIPTGSGPRYRTRCAQFPVRPHPTWRPGFVQVANDGGLRRVDYIRNVSIRVPS